MAKHSINKLAWREVVWQRPYELDQIYELLAHLAVTTPRGSVIWESRSHGGYVKHFVGADIRYISKIENVIKVHGGIQLYPTEDHIISTFVLALSSGSMKSFRSQSGLFQTRIASKRS